ncbi:AraC family transcriptional regulator [Flagellimonas taeanensis]|uniref:helix-turn-helix domain-containing protein n=1 Tax=Flavobacteriaceae TaxID=49546 RepID=UPI000E67B32D|nr:MULTISPECIES: helix-turn-helix transcriptional regulator [Allomuricauda]MDC6385796.1 helix-turn-helix transcriptional regulator [Muricauda sp. SK9]RIV50925.1 AraC family transcriptional regulator [Allomuricauda taeanensis]
MNKLPIRVNSISMAHRIRGMAPPSHPLISITDVGAVKGAADISAVLDFYMISLKRNCDNLTYGQQKYDFDEGVMAFVGPNQVLRGQEHEPGYAPKGWVMLVHPDFFWGTSLAKKIKKYEFFGYAVNEALFLSEKEEATINGIIENIRQECDTNIDKFSQDIIVSHIETLLNYSDRYYQRQFITRKVTNAKVLTQMEEILTEYFKNGNLFEGLPTVQYVADKLNVSTKYLSSMSKQLTGLTTQQHIHQKLIEKAKEKLSTTNLSVGEIAYELGFEHPQSFSKLFKTKTKQSPLEFRASFN